MTETWKPVPDWEGLYQVSDRGRVRSLPRTTTRGGHSLTVYGRILKGRPTGSGHLVVALCDAGRRVDIQVHRLVLLAFIGPPLEGQEACHYDDDPTNNHLSNLRWDTRSANVLDKVRNGRHPMASRTHCPASHPYDEENTHVGADGRRHCRACQRRWKAESRARAVVAP